MITCIAIGIAAVLAALGLMAWAYANAPEGYEADDGFHYGPDDRVITDFHDGEPPR